jgi:hypothetical protein
MQLQRMRFFVMAGLRPGHPRVSCCHAVKTWMPGTSPGMTSLAVGGRREPICLCRIQPFSSNVLLDRAKSSCATPRYRKSLPSEPRTPNWCSAPVRVMRQPSCLHRALDADRHHGGHPLRARKHHCARRSRRDQVADGLGAGSRQLCARRQPDARARWTDRRGPGLRKGYVKGA